MHLNKSICLFCYFQFLICKRKLESKKEALLILSKELDTCQQERDQYKLMANQLRERHQGLKKKYRELIVRPMKHTYSSITFAGFMLRVFPEILSNIKEMNDNCCLYC